MANAVSKHPAECSSAELGAFERLINEGGEVVAEGLRQRIMEAERLVFLKEGDGTLSAVAALKRPIGSYKRTVFRKAKSPENPNDFPCEVGWIFVKPDFRGRHYSRLLLEKVLQLAGDRNVYATTRENNDRMQTTQVRCGLTQSGLAYTSDQGDYKLVLFTRKSASRAI